MHVRIIPILFTLLLFAGLSTSVWGDAFVVDPVVQKAKPFDTINIGGVSPGETIELILNKNAGYGKDADWTQAVLQNTHQDDGISTRDSEIKTDSLIAFIQTSPLTPPGEYRLPLTLMGNTGELVEEHYTLLFRVEDDLFSSSLSVSQLSGKVNEPSTFNVLLVNDSSARVTVRVTPVLPSSWEKTIDVEMKPHSFMEAQVDVTPRFAGPKTFDIDVSRVDNGTNLETLNGTIVATPTLRDRYAAGLYGFPFFTVSLVANYLVNAFISLAL